MTTSLAELRAANPALAKFSDEDLLKAAHKVIGGDLKDVADEIGYSAPSSMMGKELYAGGNRYLGGFGHIGAAMGIPGAADYVRAKEARAEALQGLSTAPHSFEEMKFGDSEKGFWPYVGQLAAGSAPYAAEAAGYTIADIATGGALTPAIAARYAATAGTTLPRFFGGQALRSGATAAERATAEAAAREAAPGLARTAMLPAVTYPSALGDTLGNQFEESGRYNFPVGLATAAPYAALNILGLEGAIARGGLPRLGLKGLEKNMLGRAASGALATGGSEAVGETGQEVMNQVARMGVNPNAGLFDPAALARYKESAIGGGLLGGLPGSLHAFGGKAPLDKRQPADLLNRGIDANLPLTHYGPQTPQFDQPEYEAALAAQMGQAPAAPYVTPRGTPAFSMEEYEAGLTPTQPGMEEPFNLRAQLEGMGPRGPAIQPTVPAGSTKPKAVANAVRDTATAATAPVDPKLAEMTATNVALRAHLPGDLSNKTENQKRQLVRNLVGDPQTEEEAVATIKAKLAEKLTGKKDKPGAEKLIMFLNSILKTPEAEQLSAVQWADKLKAESAEAARIAAGGDPRTPGPVIKIDPTTGQPVGTPVSTAPEVPVKPTNPTELPAYQAAIMPHLLEGVKPEELEALQLVHGVGQQNAGDEEAATASLRAAAKESGIPFTTLADRANRGLNKIEANAAKVGLPLEAAQALLGMQTDLDVADIAAGTAAYEGGVRTVRAPGEEFDPEAGYERKEAVAAEGEEAVTEEGEEAPPEGAAAEAEGVGLAPKETEFKGGWTAELHNNVEDAKEEWEDGRNDDDPAWDQLVNSLQLQWVKGFLAAYTAFPKAKEAPQLMQRLGAVRKAVREGIKEHGRQQDSEAEAGADDAGAEEGGGREVGEVSGGVSGEGAGRVSPAPAGEPKGEAGAEPAVAGETGTGTKTADEIADEKARKIAFEGVRASIQEHENTADYYAEQAVKAAKQGKRAAAESYREKEEWSRSRAANLRKEVGLPPRTEEKKVPIFTLDDDAQATVDAAKGTAAPATVEQLQAGMDRLSAAEQQELADHYGTQIGRKKFFDKLAADVAKYVNQGAEAVAIAIRKIIKKVVTAVLAAGLVFNPAVYDQQHQATTTTVAAINSLPKNVVAHGNWHDVSMALLAQDRRGRRTAAQRRDKTGKPTEDEDEELPDVPAKMSMDEDRMGAYVESQMYGELKEIGPVSIKEMAQNAFDAIKDAIHLGHATSGKISIKLDKDARTITVTDSGIGMTTDIINNAFLKLAGTHKESKDPSGSFGLAKGIFLYGNKSLKLTTVRDGIESTLETTGAQLKASKKDPSKGAPIKQRRTSAPSGTTVVIELPEKYHSSESGKDEDVDFPEKWQAQQIVNDSPLFADIEVDVNGITMPVGKNFPIEDWTLMNVVDFPAWGKIRIMVSPVKYAPGQNLIVLSKGIYQFKGSVKKDPSSPWGDSVPFKFFLNVEPSVDATHHRYPFALNRQSMSLTAQNDFASLLNYLNVLYANAAAEAQSQSFGTLTVFSADGKTSKDIDLNVPKAKAGTTLAITKDDKVEIRDGRMYVNNRVMPELTKEEMEKIKTDPTQFRVDQSKLDPDQLIVHDNVVMVKEKYNDDDKGEPYLEKARAELGTDVVNDYLLTFARVFQNLRDAVAKLGGVGYADLKEVPVGVSVDIKYHGVNTSIPFRAMMLNPTTEREGGTSDEMALRVVSTMIHEFAHHTERNHSETGFIPELQRLVLVMGHRAPTEINEAIAQITHIYDKYRHVYDWFEAGGKSGNLKARGIRLEDSPQVAQSRRLPEGTARSSAGRGDAGVGTNVRAGTGTGDQDRAEGQGREGAPAADAGRLKRSEKRKTPDGKTPTTAEHTRSKLKKLFFTDKRFDHKVTVVQSIDELPSGVWGSVGENTRAFVDTADNNHVYMIADNIPKGSELAVFLHEMGVHVGMETLIGKANVIKLANKVIDWGRLNDGSLRSAIANAALMRGLFAIEQAERRGQPLTQSEYMQEMVAYFVEEAVERGVNPTAMDARTEFGRWFRTLWAAAKVALRKMGLERFDQITPQDVVNLAYGSARLEMTGVWHGTAAQFRNFRSKFMGTGEGAQAFTWGHYGGQARGTGKGYWQSDVARKSSVEEKYFYDGEEIIPSQLSSPEDDAKLQMIYWTNKMGVSNPEHTYPQMIIDRKDDLKEATDAGDQRGIEDAKKEVKFYEDALAAYHKLERAKATIQRSQPVAPEGALMRADVAMQEHEMLDWDAPFSKQSKQVRAALKKLLPEAMPTMAEVLHTYDKILFQRGKLGPNAEAQAKRINDVLHPWADEYYADMATNGMGGRGTKALSKVMEAKLNAEDYGVFLSLRTKMVEKLFRPITPGMTGEQIYRMLEQKLGGDKAASEALEAEGVKGTQFFDQMSRGRQQFTVNYIGPKDAFIPVIQQDMEQQGLTFAEAKEKRLKQIRKEMKVYSSPESQHSMQASLDRVGKAEEGHYEIRPVKHTRNVVAHSDKGLQRVVSRIGAKANRLRFSVAPSATMGTATKGATAKHLANAYAFMQKHSLGFMITEDIADLAVRSGLGEVRDYVDIAKAREAARVEHELTVGKVSDLYDDLPKGEQGMEDGSVNKFLHDATMRGNTNGIDQFSPAGQKLIRAVFQHGADTLELKKRLINEEVGGEFNQRIAEETDPDKQDALKKERASMLARFSRLMDVKNADTYAPLKRFGDYVVSAKSAEYLQAEANSDYTWLKANEGDPLHHQVHFTDSQGEADAKVADLEPTFAGGELYGAARTADIRNHHDLFRAFPVLRARLAADRPFQGEGPSPMERLISDLYLQALAENSARKSELRRRGIHGASTDMMRSFVTQGRADASFLANLQHNTQLQVAVTAMREGAKRDRKKLTPYLNEMLKRHYASYETRAAPVLDKMRRTTSLWMLATNPTYYLQQIVQPWSMSLPIIAGTHGYFRTVRALQAGYQAIAPVIKGIGLTGNIDWSQAPEDVRDMLSTVSRNGAIDATNSMEHGEWEMVDKGKLGAAWNRVDQKLRGMNTRVESVNRATTAIAAYRMELVRNGGDKAAATKYAEAMVRQTHGSYDASNTPRYMQGPVAKVLTQFRRFQIVQLSLIARLAHNAFKGSTVQEKAIARRALTYTLLHTAALGGALGMPGAVTIAALVARLFGPDDEPPDFEKWAREAIGDQTLADLLLKGVPAMLGVDLSGKLGMGQILSIAPFADFPHDRDSFNKYAASVLGPTVGLAAKAVDGLAQIYNGNVVKGAEQLLPTGFANAMRGVRFATEGVSTRAGDVTLSPDEIGFADAVFQGLGMPTTTITHQQRLARTKFEFDTYYRERTSELIHDFQQARKAGESTADVREEWNKMQEARVRNGYTRQPMSTLIKSAQLQRKREHDTAGGVEFTKANKRFVQTQAAI